MNPISFYAFAAAIVITFIFITCESNDKKKETYSTSNPPPIAVQVQKNIEVKKVRIVQCKDLENQIKTFELPMTVRLRTNTNTQSFTYQGIEYTFPAANCISQVKIESQIYQGDK